MMELTWWLRAVGVLYLFMAVVSIGPRIPIKAEGPPGVLARAAEGDPVARFVLDTWTMVGLYLGAVGISLLIASWHATRAAGLVWMVIALELLGGIGTDVYKLARGYKRAAPTVWIVIHTAVIVTGLMALGQP
jgi:BphX-like